MLLRLLSSSGCLDVAEAGSEVHSVLIHGLDLQARAVQLDAAPVLWRGEKRM